MLHGIAATISYLKIRAHLGDLQWIWSFWVSSWLVITLLLLLRQCKSYLQNLLCNQSSPKTSSIKEVTWYQTIAPWIKCTMDGTTRGYNWSAACGGLYRDKSTTTMGWFAVNLGNSSALHAELTGAIVAIEIASKKCWNYLWLESVSQILNLTF